MPAIELAQVKGQARAVIALHGADVERFLQGTLSADVRGLDAREARPATLLTVKGKIVAELIVLRRAGPDPVVYLLVPATELTAVLLDLERHVIMDDVTLEACDLAVGFAWTAAGDHGSTQRRPEDSGGEGTWTTRHPGVGWLHLAAPAAMAAWIAAHGPHEESDEVGFHAARIRHRIPAWQHEITADHFPPEVGFVHAVSYTKGCYRGQEPLARIHARGQVHWVMVAVRATEPLAPTTLPVAGHALSLRHPTRAAAGRWTSAVRRADGTIEGLAIVHRSLAEEGATLELDGQEGALAVCSGPLGDDA
jgi:folate-binding protein YgfZ